jgi:RNA polymerase sigma factor (sigma-70 family)
MTGADPDTRIAALVGAYGAALLRVARQHSLCLDDAQDAYQRALEIYLRRMDTIDVATEGAWMKVVIRHEAMAVRRSRTESVSGEEVDFDAQVDEDVRPLDDRLASVERSARSAEVLRQLKPDEATALLLKAEGHTYGEIGARNGWTYTKVNRAITEGRRRFLKTYAELESGDGCTDHRPALTDLARGTATADALLELRPHLRHCPACRAVVREMRGGRRRVAGWLPLPAILFGARRPLDYANNIGELGVPLPHPDRLVGPSRFAELKLHLQNLLQRLHGSDVVTGVQLTSSSGGGRGVSIAAAIGICLSSVGAGTYCVATLVLPEPKPVERKVDRPPSKPKVEVQAKRSPTPAPVLHFAVSTPTPTPTPSPSPKTKPRRTGPHESVDRRRVAASTTPLEQRHEDPPPAAPPVVGQQELGIERSASTAAAQPAAPPATGGEEFSP